MRSIYHRITCLLSSAVLLATLAGCDDTPQIGSSLIEDESAVVIDTQFEVTGSSVANSSIQSQTLTQLLGTFDAEGYGKFSSEFLAQFMPAAKLSDNLTRENIDSLKLVMLVPRNSFVGDSLAPMGLEVYRLNRDLPSPIYSNEDPSKYYSPSDLLGRKIYAFNTLNAPDSVKALTYIEIAMDLPKALAYEFYDLYKSDPEAYVFPSRFARHFKGIYVRNAYGSGRVIAISNTQMRMYYHTTGTDDDGNPTIVRHVGNYFAVTPEMVVDNLINYSISSDLQTRIDGGQQLLIAPVGRNIDLKFPVEDVLTAYRANAGTLSVINSLTLSIPADNVPNNYGIRRPTYVLMILTSKVKDFFLNNSLPDNKTSFIATYDDSNDRYLFNALRGYLLDVLQKDVLTPDDYSFTLMPVSVSQETSSTGYYGGTSTSISAVNPYVGTPSMVRLHLDQAQLTLTFSKQTL